jgi:hypothetical protein
VIGNSSKASQTSSNSSADFVDVLLLSELLELMLNSILPVQSFEDSKLGPGVLSVVECYSPSIRKDYSSTAGPHPYKLLPKLIRPDNAGRLRPEDCNALLPSLLAFRLRCEEC